MCLFWCSFLSLTSKDNGTQLEAYKCISTSRILENYSVIMREAVTMYQTHCNEAFVDDELFDCPSPCLIFQTIWRTAHELHVRTARCSWRLHRRVTVKTFNIVTISLTVTPESVFHTVCYLWYSVLVKLLFCFTEFQNSRKYLLHCPVMNLLSETTELCCSVYWRCDILCKGLKVYNCNVTLSFLFIK